MEDFVSLISNIKFYESIGMTRESAVNKALREWTELFGKDIERKLTEWEDKHEREKNSRDS